MVFLIRNFLRYMWGNALINGGASLGSAAIANHQQNQQLQQQQQRLQQRNFFELDSRDFDALEPRRPSSGAGQKGGSKGGSKGGNKGDKSGK
jgi:hypothetical protein